MPHEANQMSPPVATATTFKVGQNVRCVDAANSAGALKAGKVYRIAMMTSVRQGVVIRGLEDYGFFRNSRFEPYPTAVEQYDTSEIAELHRDF